MINQSKATGKMPAAFFTIYQNLIHLSVNKCSASFSFNYFLSVMVLYLCDERDVSVNAIIRNDSLWITQKAMAELFGCSTDNISLHLKNIFADGELDKDSVTEKISATAADSKNYLTQFYNLDAIILVGYRVNSKQATKFRIILLFIYKRRVSDK